jgi:hypothetical protein
MDDLDMAAARNGLVEGQAGREEGKGGPDHRTGGVRVRYELFACFDLIPGNCAGGGLGLDRGGDSTYGRHLDAERDESQRQEHEDNGKKPSLDGTAAQLSLLLTARPYMPGNKNINISQLTICAK